MTASLDRPLDGPQGSEAAPADAFAAARAGLDAYGASVEERELVELVAAHGHDEGQLLERYARYAQEAPTPAARYLVSLILDDEHRHHRLLGEIANAIGWSWEPNRPAATPALAHNAERDEAFLEQTRSLLRHEEADKRELRRLRKQLAPYEKTTAWALLIDVMIADTDKHAAILKFILEHES